MWHCSRVSPIFLSFPLAQHFLRVTVEAVPYVRVIGLWAGKNIFMTRRYVLLAVLLKML
jgi:hypothetical protein